MTREISLDLGSVRATTALFADWGKSAGLKFYRLSLQGNGRGEAEFLAPNPIEVLVFKWDDEEELREILSSDAGTGAVFRKKCTKCLMHERPAP